MWPPLNFLPLFFVSQLSISGMEGVFGYLNPPNLQRLDSQPVFLPRPEEAITDQIHRGGWIWGPLTQHMMGRALWALSR